MTIYLSTSSHRNLGVKIQIKCSLGFMFVTIYHQDAPLLKPQQQTQSINKQSPFHKLQMLAGLYKSVSPLEDITNCTVIDS